MAVTLKTCASIHDPGWLALRMALWPDCARDERLAEMAAQVRAPRFVSVVFFRKELK